MPRQFWIDIDEPALQLLIASVEVSASSLTRFVAANPGHPQLPEYRDDIRTAEALLLLFSRTLAGGASRGPSARGRFTVFN